MPQRRQRCAPLAPLPRPSPLRPHLPLLVLSLIAVHSPRSALPLYPLLDTLTHDTPPQQNSPAFVTFLTAGFPSVDATVPLMLAMERGGADIIELGVPFTDPLADGKAIQDCNNVRSTARSPLSQGGGADRGPVRTSRLRSLRASTTTGACSSSARRASKVSRLPSSSWVRHSPSPYNALSASKLTPLAPTRTGYFNPLLAHGEERAVQDAKEAGANGFIIVDLPPEEAVEFRKICTREGCVPRGALSPSNRDRRADMQDRAACRTSL